MGSEERGDLVVVDLGPSAPEDLRDSFSDAVQTEPPTTGLERRVRGWWTSAGPRQRVFLVTAIALSVVSAAAIAVGAGADRAVHVQTRTVTDPVSPSGVDAIGCPVGRTCAVRRPVGAVALVERAYQGLSVASAYETYDVTSKVVWRRDILAIDPDPATTVHIVAQCVPNGPGLSDVALAGGMTIVGSPTGRRQAVAETTRFDSDGCSVVGRSAETLVAEGDPFLTDDDVLTDLVNDPTMRLSTR